MSFPEIGGSERRSLRHAQALAARGDRVTIVTLRHRRDLKSREQVDGIPFVRVGGGVYRRSGRLRIGRVGIVPVALALSRRLLSFSIESRSVRIASRVQRKLSWLLPFRW